MMKIDYYDVARVKRYFMTSSESDGDCYNGYESDWFKLDVNGRLYLLRSNKCIFVCSEGDYGLKFY